MRPGMVEMVQHEPAAQPWLPLLKGLQTHDRSLRWGADQVAAFNAALPNRMAYKHAHSRQNPEKDWGQNTLSAVRFAPFATSIFKSGALVATHKSASLMS